MFGSFVWVLYQSPGSFRVLQNNLSILRPAFLWKEMLELFLGIWTHSSSLGGHSSTVVFTPHPLQLISQTLQFLLSLLSSVPPLLGMATPITSSYLSSFSTMSGWLVITRLSVCACKSHRIFVWSFSTNVGGASHFDLRVSSLDLTRQMYLYTIPATWLWNSMYGVLADIQHPASMCWMVSEDSLNSLCPGPCMMG